MKYSLAAAALITLTLLPINTQADITVKPGGLKIIWDSMKEQFDGFQTFNSEKGVHVCLGVHAGDKGFIELDKDKSDLSLSDGVNDLGAELGHWNKISKDTKTMRVEVHSDQLPAADASKLVIKGELVVSVASKKETLATELREFSKGDQVEPAESFKFEVEKIGDSSWGNYPFSISLKWKRKIPELADIRFYGPDGELIESTKGGSSSMGFAGKYTVTRSYRLKKKVEKLKIEFDLWTDKQAITVPVNMEMALGGGK